MLALDPLADHRAAEVLPSLGDGSKRGAGLTGPVGQPGSARLVVFHIRGPGRRHPHPDLHGDPPVAA